MDLNVRRVFTLIQKCLPLLEKGGTVEDPARIIVTGSVAGIRPPGGPVYGYAASKAAVAHLTSKIGVDVAARHITANTIAPGMFPSKMTAVTLDTLGVDNMEQGNPLGRLGLPRDIIGLMLFLCSRAGAYVNGAVIPLDGGKHISAAL